VEQLRQNGPSVTQEKGDMIPPTAVPGAPNSMPRANPSGPKIRPDRTTSRSSVVTVRGEVTAPDQLTPKGSAKLVFVNAADQSVKQYATANEFGEFDVKLAAGTWYLYLGNDAGKAVYHKQVNVGDRDSYDYKVVSR
jgi:hypothetical protein